MSDKPLYLVIGILVGIIIVLVAIKIPSAPPAYAAEPANLMGGGSGEMIALTTNPTKTPYPTIICLVDVKRSNLLVYEYHQDLRKLKLSAFRDIGYDLNIPDGYAGYEVERGQNPLNDIYYLFEKTAKELEINKIILDNDLSKIKANLERKKQETIKNLPK